MIEWCTALEWSAVIAWHGCSSGSIFPGRFVHRLRWDFEIALGLSGLQVFLILGAVSYVYRGEEVRSVYCCMIGDGNWIRSIERIGGGTWWARVGSVVRKADPSAILAQLMTGL